ncbi:MerR family transcriptional regulator [Acidisoma sp. C75]
MTAVPLAQPAPGAEEEESVRARLKKAPTAFRTISEVADDLHIPQHVLRFWETKFTQVRPLKRGGGRRYYRPDDVALLRRIAHLLYTQGYTIKGVQRLLREGGGRLADDIPPPRQDDQDGEGEQEAAELLAAHAPPAPMPDLPEQRLPLRFIPRPGAVAAAAAGLAAPASETAAEQELARIKRVMRDLLDELEALRHSIS